MDSIGWTNNLRPGFRLKRLEVTNWGTFDSTAGQITSLAPEGRSALLVGQNGSGKSTLVDALLTLLVQPGVRNYNVAAGAKKRERDERSYIRGACGRSTDQELGLVTDYLRAADRHYSVLLACFENQETSAAFTVAQVLQITGDGEVDKTYAYVDQPRSIANDLNNLQRGESIRKQLIERGFRATTKYTEYLSWIARRTHMRPKAMDVFNQTVAVKDIQSLNSFIREHMLEAHPWRDKIEGLLGHFSQLSQAHQSLLKARRQIEYLEPIELAAEQLRILTQEAQDCQRNLEATDSFFRQHIVEWIKPRLQGNQRDIETARLLKNQLQQESSALDDTRRYYQNEIEQTGGQRLRELPLQVETQHALLAAKKRELSRLNASLKILGIAADIQSRTAFERLPLQLSDAQGKLVEQSTRIAQARLEGARQLTDARTALEDAQREFQQYEHQAGSLPPWLAEVRTAMVSQLRLPAGELVFACELMRIIEEERQWQPAIEMVLRRFALGLLVPERHYRAVSSYIEQNRLTDARGRGQRLVYVRVPETVRRKSEFDTIHPLSLVRKLLVVTSHPLSPWLTSELSQRFDYRCCETIEQFQNAPRLALTQQRHVKYGAQQHEKDDRSQVADTSSYVLGGDHSSRLQELSQRISECRAREAEIERQLLELESESRMVSRQNAAIDAAASIPDFDLIDVERHLRAIEQLEQERRGIESSNESVRELRLRLDETLARRTSVQEERDKQVALESQLMHECDQAESLLERHQQVLATRRESGRLQEHALVFPALIKATTGRLEAVSHVSEFLEVQADCSRQFQDRLNQIQQQLDPLRADAVRCMQKFLSDSPQERADLRADLPYIDGFLGLLEQLRLEDLPRHEQRFRERLNDKVMQEIGLFHAALQCERHEIITKIETLNASLEQLEYRSGTHMRLEPRPVGDREVRDFQTLLKECLNEHFDGNAFQDEAKFLRIEKLIRRFRDEERWRDKVTDVRRWFDFTARELDVVTGEERSCYEDSSGQSGGEKAKLAFTILVAAIAYQFDIDPAHNAHERLHFVVVDEMFSKVDDRYAEYALQLFEKFGLQLLIVAPLDAKARVTEPYVGCYLHTVKDEATRKSQVISMTASEYETALYGPSSQSNYRRTASPSGMKPIKPR
jgi:uncharacterized protein YPO0396